MSIGRQLETLEALKVILNMAGKRSLTGVDWRVPDSGSNLVGEVPPYRRLLKSAPRLEDTVWELYDDARVRQRQVFDSYAEIVEELCRSSVEKYGPGNADFHLGTEVARWPERTDSTGSVRLQVTAKHVTVSLGRDRKAWLLSLTVIAELPGDEDEPPPAPVEPE